MATLIEISRHPGILRGEGIESNCTVETEDVIALGLPPVHVCHHITWVEQDLPEGNYQLFVHGKVVAGFHLTVGSRRRFEQS
jgi:hypothetical protein